MAPGLFYNAHLTDLVHFDGAGLGFIPASPVLDSILVTCLVARWVGFGRSYITFDCLITKWHMF